MSNVRLSRSAFPFVHGQPGLVKRRRIPSATQTAFQQSPDPVDLGVASEYPQHLPALIGEPDTARCRNPALVASPSSGSASMYADPPVVVDGDVEEVIAGAAAADLFAASVQPPPAAVGYSPELLDIDMQQVSGVTPFVVDPGVAATHRSSGDRVDHAEMRNPVAAQGPPDGGGNQSELPGQEHRAPMRGRAQGHGLGLGLSVGPGPVADQPASRSSTMNLRSNTGNPLWFASERAEVDAQTGNARSYR